MRDHLEGCADCRRYYERHLLLAALDPSAPSAKERLGRGLGLDAARGVWPALPASAVAAAALCALCGLVFVVWRAVPSADREFAARSGAVVTPSAELVVYRLARGGVPERVERRIGRDDELLFAYTNPEGFRYLLVFGVDERGQVYWYHPAWTDPSHTPAAVPIRPGPDLVELPEAVHHELEGRRLRLYAIFSESRPTVRELEDRVKSQGTAAPGVLLPGTFQRELLVEVE